MSLTDRVVKLFRSNPFNNPGYPMSFENVNSFLEAFGGTRTDSGEVVTTANSMKVSTVWACVSLISSQIAINSLFLYELDTQQNKKLAVDHDYFDLIVNRPNPEMDSVKFRTAVETSVLLHGNGYIELNRNGAGRVVEMWHRSATSTKPFRNAAGNKGFVCADNAAGEERFIPDENMIHIMGETLDGWLGLSPIAYHSQTIGKNMAMERFGERFFANSATPSGILTTSAKLKPEDKARMRQAWEEMQTGRNVHKVAVLDQEVKFEKLTIPQSDAQYLETLDASEKDIARIFGVPGAAIGLLDKGIKANVEQQARDLYTYCLRPRMVRWEKAINTKLFSTRGRSAGRHIVKFDTRELLMPDTASKVTYFQSGIQNGWLNQDEVRNIEGFNAIPQGDGDGYYIQLNMQPLGAANALDPQKNPPDTELSQVTEENSLPISKIGGVYRSILRSGTEKFMKSSTKATKVAFNCFWPTIDAIARQVTNAGHEFDEKNWPETHKTVNRLVESMEHRSKKWNEDAEAACDAEMSRILKALIFAKNHDLAEAKARREAAELEADTMQENDNE